MGKHSITIYRCRHCGNEVVIAQEGPPKLLVVCPRVHPQLRSPGEQTRNRVAMYMVPTVPLPRKRKVQATARFKVAV